MIQNHPLDFPKTHYFVPPADSRGETMSALHIRVNDRNAIVDGARKIGLETTDDAVRLCGVLFRLVV